MVSKLAHFIPSKNIMVEKLPELTNLNLADPYFYNLSPIDMIIGSYYLPVINMTGVLSNIGSGLEARESQFGWYLLEPMISINTFTTCISSPDNQLLHEDLKKIWQIEEI